MQAPRYAVISIALDTQAHRALRPEVRKHKVAYLLDRLLCGLDVAESGFTHLGMKVSIRPAVSPEILRDHN